MAYNKFKKIATLRDNFGITDNVISWLPDKFASVPISPFLLQNLLDAKEEALGTEKAKSEYIIAPVLKELRRNNPNRFSYFSGYRFDVDSKLNLQGFCDFIFSASPHRVDIESPIFCIVEAKKDSIEDGLAQCGAEMYAAYLYNDKKNQHRNAIYGCVTNAFSWCFLKLEEKNLFIDPNYIPLTFTEPSHVLAVLQWILDECLPENHSPLR